MSNSLFTDTGTFFIPNFQNRKNIEDELNEGHIDGSANAGTLDVVSVIAYENHLNQCTSN